MIGYRRASFLKMPAVCAVEPRKTEILMIAHEWAQLSPSDVNRFNLVGCYRAVILRRGTDRGTSYVSVPRYDGVVEAGVLSARFSSKSLTKRTSSRLGVREAPECDRRRGGGAARARKSSRASPPGMRVDHGSSQQKS